MQSATAKKIVAIFLIIIGALALVGVGSSDNPIMTMILSIAMIVIGILLLVRGFEKIEKGLVITSLVLLALQLPGVIIVALVVPLIGGPTSLLFIVPFIFSIIYLSAKKKEGFASSSYYPRGDTFIRSPDQDHHINHQTLESLKTLESLYDQGLISQEEYEKKRQNLLKM